MGGTQEPLIAQARSLKIRPRQNKLLEKRLDQDNTLH